jgi:hypothetical protein
VLLTSWVTPDLLLSSWILKVKLDDIGFFSFFTLILFFNFIPQHFTFYLSFSSLFKNYHGFMNMFHIRQVHSGLLVSFFF